MAHNKKTQLFRKLSWQDVITMLEFRGWKPIKNTRTTKIFQRGNFKLAMLKFPKGKWKVELLLNNRLYDSAGFNDEQFAKVLAVEFGVVR